MSVLTMVQDAVDDIGLPEVTQVVGNSDRNTRALLRALNTEGLSLLTEDPPFAILNKEHTFQTVNGQDSYDLPDDWEYGLNNTTWDQTVFWQVRGDITPMQWQLIRSGLYQTARLSSNFRIVRDPNGTAVKKFRIDPVPGDDAPHTIVFEYISNGWLTDGMGSFFSRAQSDSDTALLNEELITMGIIWRFLKARDLPYDMQFAEYKDRRDRIVAQARPSPTLGITKQPWRLPIGNVPDTGFGIT